MNDLNNGSDMSLTEMVYFLKQEVDAAFYADEQGRCVAAISQLYEIFKGDFFDRPNVGKLD